MWKIRFQSWVKFGGGLLVRKALRRTVPEVAAAPSGHAHSPFKSS